MMSRLFFYICLLFLQISSSAQVNLKWAKKFGLIYSSAEGNSVATDASGNVYSTGVFGGGIDFDPGPDTFLLGAAGAFCCPNDVYISKLDSSGNFVWARRIGSPSNTFQDYSFSIALDKTGNVYITGAFADVVDFDPDTGTYNLTATGATDIFILKLNSAGKFVWAKTMGGGSWDIGYSVHVDPIGNVYTTGFFRGTAANFDPNGSGYTMTSAGMDDVFVTKHNASGNFIWAKQLGGKGNETGYGITTDAALKVYVTGFYSDTADFNTGSGTTNLISNGGKDIFVAKLDTAGNLIWAKSIGGPGDDQANAIVLDPTNHVYTTGEFMNGADFDPNTGSYQLVSQGSLDIFISKLDTGGNFVWAKSMGGGGGDFCKSISLDSAENIYTTGYFTSIADFDPSPVSYFLTSNGWSDKFILKIDKLGNFVWAHATGGSDRDYGHSIAISPGGNIHTTGHFQKTIDFDPSTSVFNMTATGGNDAFVSKLWNCVTSPVIITPSKNTNICPKDTVVLTASHAASYLWSTGATTRSIKVSTTDTFKVTATNSAGCPAYTSITVKVHQDTTIIDKYICQGSSFLFNGNQLTIAGVYRDTLPNFAGCDSLVILNLYIKNVDTTHVYDTLCGNMPVTFNNLSLTLAGTYRDTLRKLNGCDSHIFYHFIPKPIYNMPINRAICKSDSSLFGGKYLKISGTYSDTLKSINNCDSITNLTLIVRGIDTTIVYDTLCGNLPKTFNNQSLTTAGFYRDTLKNIAGCDSHIFYHFIPKPSYETPLSRSICANDSSLFGGKYRKLTGVYYDTLKTILNCDSVLKLTLTVHKLDTTYQTQSICKGKTYNFHNQILTIPGNYSHKLKNKNNCDSLILLTLSLGDTSSYSFSQTICKSQSYSFNNQNLNVAGVYRDTLTNAAGCDSFVTLNLATNGSVSNTIELTRCYGDIYQGYTQSGNYVQTLTSHLGCDSLLTIKLTYLPATEYKTVQHNKCGAFVYDSRTYTQNDSFTETIKNYLNCDSIVTKHLVTITKPNPMVLESKSIPFCEEILHRNQAKTQSFFTQDTVKSAEFPYCDSLYQPIFYQREVRPDLAIYAASDTAVRGQSIQLSAALANNYRWNTGEQTTVIRPKIEESAIFTVRGWNLENCESQASISITAIEPLIIDFPTAFSPNGDGLNDSFYPNTNQTIIIESFDIYNRIGEKVYSYTPQSPSWNGFYLGQSAAMGVYSYILNYRFLGNQFTKTGEVMVVR
jgi:gliding motility-associated-like protein